MKRALITGITGQDGSYLAELLLEKGYEIHGTIRRTSLTHSSRLQPLLDNREIYQRRLFLHYADIDDPTTLRRVLLKVAPQEVYHLAGQSHVGLSFEIPESTCELTALGTLRLLEMLRDMNPPPKLYHASSSEVFGRPTQVPQDENTPFLPVSPYGCAKAFATRMTTIYREAFGLFACSGIMYNHESPRRGEAFVSRKVCRAAARIKLGLESELILGDLDACRDWGDARDYVTGMWMLLQLDKPEDVIFATGILHSVRDIVEVAFDTVQLNWRDYVRQDPSFMRATEPSQLVGNPAKARSILGWDPAHSFEDMLKEMTIGELSSCSSSET